MLSSLYKPTNIESESLNYSSFKAEQVRVLYSHLPTSILISALLGIILLIVQSAVVSFATISIWSSVLAVALFARVVLYMKWKRHYKPANASRYLLYFRSTVGLIGIVWAAGGVLLTSDESVAHTVYVSFALAGLCAGASSTLAIDRVSMVCFMLPIQIFQIVFHIAIGDSVSIGIGVLWFLYLVFLLGSSQPIRLRLEESYYLREQASKSESRLLQILESSPIATSISYANNGEVVFANNRYSELFGLSADDVIGMSPENYYTKPKEYIDVIQGLTKGDNIVNIQTEIRSPCGQLPSKWVLASYFPMVYHDKPAVLAWLYDITERKLVEDETQYRANHDILTGLPNRNLYRSLLNQMITTAKRESSILAVMFLDLDEFKPVNDHHGHNIGDHLLTAVSERITACLRESDTAARIGGDEFVILLPDVKTQENALMVAENIRHALSEPFEIEGLTLNISSSIGIALYPNHASSEYQLTEAADIAMYYAKSKGRNRVLVYKSDMKRKQ